MCVCLCVWPFEIWFESNLLRAVNKELWNARNKHAQMQAMEMWFELACLSAFLLPVLQNTHTHMHAAIPAVCAVVQAVCVCVCLCARLLWSRRSSPSCLLRLFFIKMPLSSSSQRIGSSWRHFLSFSFFFSPFQATLDASSRVSSSIFSFLQSFVHFSVYILTVCLSCALSLTFAFVVLFFFIFPGLKNPPTCLNSKAKHFTFFPPSLTIPPKNKWIIFIHDQTGLWMMLLGAQESNCAFELYAVIDGEKLACVFVCRGCSLTIFKFRRK